MLPSIITTAVTLSAFLVGSTFALQLYPQDSQVPRDAPQCNRAEAVNRCNGNLKEMCRRRPILMANNEQYDFWGAWNDCATFEVREFNDKNVRVKKPVDGECFEFLGPAYDATVVNFNVKDAECTAKVPGYQPPPFACDASATYKACYTRANERLGSSWWCVKGLDGVDKWVFEQSCIECKQRDLKHVGRRWDSCY